MPDFFHPHTALLRPPGGTYRSARANVRTGLVLVLLLLTALYVATSAPRADAAAPATASIVTTQPAATTAAIADVSGVTAATIDAYLGGVRSPMASPTIVGGGNGGSRRVAGWRRPSRPGAEGRWRS